VIDHIILKVSNFETSRDFYKRALAPLDYQVMMEQGSGCGFSVMQHPDFWITESDTATTPIHIAFTCRDRAIVDAFHAEALAAGGTDNGAPGLRAEYHPSYYGAFVLDPDGHNIEAVCHRPQ
jgi:catechol 2,3-dioxygenase-like lactoylglutathione lyase family enzyme